ncbi:MAG: class I SAM-dependent methyltransferase [Candidatus Gastranaerophilaceae bacterium]
MKNFDELYENIKTYSEMTKSECKFLYDSIMEVKPKKILEVGVSSGASSSLILEAVKNNSDAKLYSVDLIDNYYKNHTKKTGFLVKEKFKEHLEKYKLYTNGTIADFIEEIGNGIDFVFLDSSHGIPGEVLDFITILPYCKEGAVFVIHDINIQLVHPKPTLSIAPKLLILSVDADKEFPKETEHKMYNIAKIKSTHSTMKNIENVFSALLSRWVRPVTQKQYDKFIEILSKHYDYNLVNYFKIAAEKFRYENKPESNKNIFLKKMIKILQKYVD